MREVCRRVGRGGGVKKESCVGGCRLSGGGGAWMCWLIRGMVLR